MNEENSTVIDAEPAPKQKKKHSLWWLKLLLVLCVFAGGIIFGLKLPEMYLPEPLNGMLFPDAVQSESTAPAAPSPVEATLKPEAGKAPTVTEAPKESTEPSAAPSAVVKPETVKKPEESVQDGFIGIDAALKAALDHAGVKESDAEVFGVYKTKEEDISVYSVEFAVDSKEYSYSINAVTGVVEGWKVSHTYVQNTYAAPSPYSYPEPTSSASSNLQDVIDQDAAKKAAFEHAGVKEADVSGLKIDLELDGRVLIYDVEFHSGIYEYEYIIDAVDGNVLGFDKEIG